MYYNQWMAFYCLELLKISDSYIDGMLNFTVAEAIIPLQPRQLPSYIAGAILSNNLAIATDVLSAPINNLRVAANYVRSGHNSSHTLIRAAEVLTYTAKVNAIAS